MDDETVQVGQLLAEAQEILQILRVGARRAYVLEVTGTPKAGKTSVLGLVHGFFRRAGFKVHTLRERAGDCPIPMKGHFFFNAWTTCTMMAEVLATYDTDVDLIVLDRGFFDALIWLDLQLKRGQVSKEEASVFESFVLLERWRTLVDLTIVMTVEPSVAMQREGNGVLLPRTGSLMNASALAAFNDAVNASMDTHHNDFRFIKIDTSADTNAKSGAIELLVKLLPKIRSWAEQHILVAPRELVKQTFGGRTFLHAGDAEVQWKTLQPHMQIQLRHKVEQNNEYVQIVGCGIVVHENLLFVLRRTAKDEKNAYGRSTLWKGCHIQGEQPVSLDSVAAQVRTRVLEELHLKTELSTELLGMAWVEGSAPESRHLGVMFLARIADSAVAKSMKDKEFRKSGRGHVMTGTFQTQQQIIRSLDQLALEPWSTFAVQNIGLKEPT